MPKSKPPSNVVPLPKRTALDAAVDLVTKGAGPPTEEHLQLLRNARAALMRNEERLLLKDIIRVQVGLVADAAREFRRQGWSEERADRAALDLVAPRRPPPVR